MSELEQYLEEVEEDDVITDNFFQLAEEIENAKIK